MSIRSIALVGSAIVVLQLPLICAIYLFVRRRRPVPTDQRMFDAFRGIWFVATALMTGGPLLGFVALTRFRPYETPFGEIDPLTVTGVGTDAWVVGFVLFLLGIASLEWASYQSESV